MSRGWIALIPIIFSLGCFSLEPFYFENQPLDEYLATEDMEDFEHYKGIIPQELIVADSFVVDGDTLYGMWAMREGDSLLSADTSVATVLYNHGNEGNINNYWARVEILWSMGFRVYIYDYPGYGRSQGEPSSQSCFASSQDALNQVLYHHAVDTARIVFYGYSLGSYMSTHLAADARPPAALILEGAPASTAALLKDSGLLELPAGVVSADDFDNEKRIAEVEAPLLLIHGKADDYIIFERNALVLWELALEPKDSLWVEDAGHGDIPFAAEEEYTRKLQDFLKEYLSE